MPQATLQPDFARYWEYLRWLHMQQGKQAGGGGEDVPNIIDVEGNNLVDVNGNLVLATDV